MDGILVINKPAGMTSHDVIARLRRQYKQKKFGHAGTLDPDVTGVLVVLAGKAAKALQFLQDTDKEYIATLALGTDTDTDDASGNVIETRPVSAINLEKELKKLEGKQHLKVPAASAKKVAGKKLLDYQREGKEVPEVYQDIEIFETEVLDADQLKFRVACSSGTYVRALCREIAHNSGNCGHMQSLTRTKACGFSLEDAEPLDQESHTVHSLKQALDSMPKQTLEDLTPVYQGKPLELDREEERILIVDETGEPVAVYDKCGSVYKSKRGLW